MRYSQPQSGPANVDTSNEFGRWLRASITGSIKLEPVRRKELTYSSGVSFATTKHGIATQHSASNGAVSFGATGGFSTVIAQGTPFTVFMRVFVSVLGVRQIYAGDFDAAGTNASFNLEITSGNVWRFETVDTVPASRIINISGATLGWHDIFAVHTPGVGNSFYVDSAAPSTVSFAANLRAGSAMRFGAAGLLTTIGFQGRIAAAQIFGRVFTDAQRKSLSANPWQVYRAPQPIYLYKAAAGGGASYTLACAAGSYSLDGASAGLIAAHRIEAAQGSYVLTGNPSALQAGHILFAAAGAYVMTGNAANLIYTPPGVVMPAAGGSYALTGNDVTMRAAHRLVTESGSYTLTGNAVTTPGEEVPPTTGGGGAYGGGGNVREVRAFADLLTKARPTKAAKKRLRRVLEEEALELLPDEPEAVKAAQEIAAVVAKKELQAIERRPAAAEPLKALPFDPSEMIRKMVDEWLANEAIRQELEDEEEAEMLLMG